MTQFSGITNLNDVISALPDGKSFETLCRNMGIWSAALHRHTGERAAFPSNLATLTPEDISNELGTWTSEFGRLAELLGALSAHRERLRIGLKSATARARSNARKAAAEAGVVEGEDTGARSALKPKNITAGELSDLAEEDPTVIEVNDKLVVVEMMYIQIGAVKEATAQYLASISREIAYRDAQMKARIYG